MEDVQTSFEHTPDNKNITGQRKYEDIGTHFVQNQRNIKQHKKKGLATERYNLEINPNLNTDKIGFYSILNKQYDINIENRNEIRIKDGYENILIFTDGSKD